jgi:hypothetical protein
MGRVLARQGVDVDGVTAHDVNEARRALQEIVYAHRPDFAPLDRQYAELMRHEGQTENLLATV